MSVANHGLEAIRRSAIISPTEGDINEYCIRVCQDGTVEITGNVGRSGLSVAGKNTTMDVSTTALKLPATPLADRNSMLIRNLDPTADLFIGFSSSVSSTLAVGNDYGWLIGADETYNVDITDSIEIWGIVASGTIKVQIQEFS